MTEAVSQPPLAGYREMPATDPFESLVGPFYWNGRDHFAFRAERRHCNSNGIIHGGLLMTFADMVACVAAKEPDWPEQGVMTVSLTSDFVAPGQEGDLIEGRGIVVRRARTLAFMRAEIATEARMLLSASAVVKLAQRPAS